MLAANQLLCRASARAPAAARLLCRASSMIAPAVAMAARRTISRSLSVRSMSSSSQNSSSSTIASTAATASASATASSASASAASAASSASSAGVASSELASRIGRASLMSRVVDARDLVHHFADGQDIGWSGFAPAGYPKVVPLAVADYLEENDLKYQFDVFAGASVGVAIEDRWASLGLTRSRWPYQGGVALRKRINDGTTLMGDIHLSKFAETFEFGFYTRDNGGELDVGIIEVSEILPNGGLVPGAGIGIAAEIADKARKVILEVNTSIPSYKGLHDIVPDMVPPNRRPFLISRVDDRVGQPFIQVDPDKIVGIVESQSPDVGVDFAPPDAVSQRIAGHIMDFFEAEVAAGRLPENLLPLQSGVGNIANAVVGGLTDGPWSNLNVWTEVLQDTMLDFFDSGKLDFASCASVTLSEKGFKRFYDNWDEYKSKIIIRPQQITNHPELVRRLGVIAMNTPVEFDMYGHANSTCVNGSKMLHGLGGSGDFLRSGYLSIMHGPSARASKTDPTGISCVLPMCTHIDHTEHDISVVVTEQGLADLRGLPPRVRARTIIDKCVHPDFKAQMTAYLDHAEKTCLAAHAGHEPQLLTHAFKMHENLMKNGTMKLDSWDF
jgi:acetyl-CoA hydrolase